MLGLQSICIAVAMVAVNSSDPAVGVNVVVRGPVGDHVLAELGRYGKVLDVIPQIGAVTLRADDGSLAALRSLPFVADADVDSTCEDAGLDPLPVPDFSAGSNEWSLDAIDVTDAGGSRVVDYDGNGVYVAVIDTGLPHNWRDYFPEQRIATQFARAFFGGGGEAAVVSSQPNKWEHDTNGHGTTLTSIILGFAYAGSDPNLPRTFNGVAPRATVIPVMVGGASLGTHGNHWESLIAHAIVYVTDLRVSGALGNAPLIINLSSGNHRPLPLERAAIDYAIANGVIVVAAAGNEAAEGMRFPAAYPELISVGATAWTKALPLDDPTATEWILRDVAEDAVSEQFVAPFSSYELPGQQLDVLAPGTWIPVPQTINGTADYTFIFGTSQATPHVAGIAALMLQKNPGLTQAQIESILVGVATPIAPGCADVIWVGANPGNPATWDDHSNVFFFPATFCWTASPAGHGLVKAGAALAATPMP
jgi:subtilisin family serine protease